MDSNNIQSHAQTSPDKPAIIMAFTDQITTHGELDRKSSQGAHLIDTLGLKTGDRFALCIENCSEFIEVAWSALRVGLTVVPVSAMLTPKEISFIVRDSGAKVLVTSARIGTTFEFLPDEISGAELFCIGEPAPKYRSWRREAGAQPTTPIGNIMAGSEMLYSSGTTGQPKGIQYLTSQAEEVGAIRSTMKVYGALGIDTDDKVYFSPSPLYHAAPFAWAMATLRLGGTVVVVRKFDAEQALSLIQKYRITITQWVPTHLVRMLKLPEQVRKSYDLSSLRFAVHAAAPCPVPVKRAMIEWWGPILWEYFGSTEQKALTFISASEWLEHPGSVGKCVLGKLHICDDEGEPVPLRTVGHIYSEGGAQFEYYNSPEKTEQSRNRYGWTTVGDIGYLDEEGYLYLTDRKSFMIITGGVNVYPQEIENLLVTHPRIADAAVIGTPDDDLGERVTAIIQPIDMADANENFAEELKRWMRQSLSGVKVPKRIEFRANLPRLPTGKLVKHALREEYSSPG